MPEFIVPKNIPFNFNTFRFSFFDKTEYLKLLYKFSNKALKIRNFNLIFYIKDRVEVDINYKKSLFSAGNLYIIPPNSIVQFDKKSATKNSDYFVMIFSDEFIAQELKGINIDKLKIDLLEIPFENTFLYKDLFIIKQIYDFYLQEAQTPLVEKLIIQSVRYLINNVNDYLISKENKTLSNTHKNVIAKLRILFLSNPSILNKIDYYAINLNLSKFKLNQITIAATGMSLKKLINFWLLEEIKKDLLMRTLSIKQIAFKYEFSEATNFSKFFKRNEGINIQSFLKKK